MQVKICTNIQKVKCFNNPSPPQVDHQVSHTREMSEEEVETAVEAIDRFICHWGHTTQHKVQTTVFVKLHILGRHAPTVLCKTRTGFGLTDEQAPEAVHRSTNNDFTIRYTHLKPLGRGLRAVIIRNHALKVIHREDNIFPEAERD